MCRLFIVGFPSLYGGAGTELHHQILLWVKAFPYMELHIVPTMTGYQNEPLYESMVKLGVTIHDTMDFSMITWDDAVINFCSRLFLESVEQIYQKTRKILWVNCMSYVFPMEQEKAGQNYISHYLYQRDAIMQESGKQLRGLGSTGKFMRFLPYFADSTCEYIVKEDEFTNIGRISRQDADKFHAQTLHIYEYITSPKWKRGHFLGFGEKAMQKIGAPPSWVRLYANQNAMPVHEFYKTVDFIVQPTDTLENWPRIGMEAMCSGKPLVVDNRGGWQQMIEHKKTGFLCDNVRDFIYWGTRLSYEPSMREDIASNARESIRSMTGFSQSADSWERVFTDVFC